MNHTSNIDYDYQPKKDILHLKKNINHYYNYIKPQETKTNAKGGQEETTKEPSDYTT